ncbi:MAG: methyltransferase domain-containing protein [Elusimicrobia bacterium]|nr:methyltransferase domain-containing protein [Elusimicrobiota bacterium]
MPQAEPPVFWPDFTRRSAVSELMDDPAVKPGELRRTLRELAGLNRALGGYPPSLAGVEVLIPRGRRNLSLLDVGAGGGDTVRVIAAWARERGLSLRAHGIDLSPAAVDFARDGSRGLKNLRFSVHDLFAMPQTESYDIVHAALLLHHCPRESAATALKKMFALCRWGLVVNDLHRHPAAYWGVKAVTGALSRNRLIRHDAPASVLRAFSRADLEDLVRRTGLPRPQISWRWAFRWQMVIRK